MTKRKNFHPAILLFFAPDFTGTKIEFYKAEQHEKIS
jgi:hypothetical protein